jgi:hypothetical protein
MKIETSERSSETRDSKLKQLWREGRQRSAKGKKEEEGWADAQVVDSEEVLIRPSIVVLLSCRCRRCFEPFETIDRHSRERAVQDLRESA